MTLLTFLPYHATPLFATLMSLLPPKLPSNFRFLTPYLSSLSNPPRQVLINACVKSSFLFTAINNYVLRTINHRLHSITLISFWASISTQIIEGMIAASRIGRSLVQNKHEEDLLLLILPVLNQGLNFKFCPEMIVACYTIITIMVSKMQMEEKTLDSLMEAVIKSRTDDIESSCLICEAIIAQERGRLYFSKAALKQLTRIQDLPRKLSELSRQCRIDRLALGYAAGVIDRSEKFKGNKLKDVEEIIMLRLLDDSQLKIVFRKLLRSLLPQDNSTMLTPSSQSYFSSTLSRVITEPFTHEIWQAAMIEDGYDVESVELRLGAALPKISPQLDNNNNRNEDAVKDGLPNQFALRTSDLQARIQKVKDLDKSITSFLVSSKHDDIYEELSQLFQLSAAEPNSYLTSVLLELPIFRRHDALKFDTYFSFLIRISSQGDTPTVKAVAWRTISEEIRTYTARKEAVDWQTFLPHVVFGLSDVSLTVRRAAAECLNTIDEHNNAIKSWGGLDAPKVWGRNLYTKKAKETEWLSPADAIQFVSKVLIPESAEFVLDDQRVRHTLSFVLSGPQRQLQARHSVEPDAAGFKSSSRAAIVSFLASYAYSANILSLQLSLFSLIADLGKHAASTRASFLLPKAREWFSFNAQQAGTICRNQKTDEAYVDLAYLNVIQPRESEGMDLLKNIIEGELAAARSNVQEAAFDRLQQLWPGLKELVQQEIATLLLDIALERVDDALAILRRSNAMATLKSVSLSTASLVNFLDNIPNATRMSDQSPPTKKRRTSHPSNANNMTLDQKDLKGTLHRLTLVLEIIDNSTPGNHPQLLRGLFRVLADLQHYKTQTNSPLVYLENLAISALLSIVQVLKDRPDSNIDTSIIRTDLLVDCIRHTTNPQIQNTALLLISSIASWQPEIVLHSVMPIFTFMGPTLLRQYDEFSVHVIDQTVSRVVPPLAASLRKKNQNFILGIAELLLSFVTAFEHIPMHRRISLFDQLIETLGPEDSIAPIMALLFDKYSTEQDLPVFVSSLMRTFEPNTSVISFERTLDLINDGLQLKRQTTDALFGYKGKAQSEIEQSLLNILQGLVVMLKDSQLRIKFERVLSKNGPEASSIRQQYSRLLEKAIILANSTKSRPLLNKACKDVFMAALSLLPTQEFVKTAEVLLRSTIAEVHQFALKAIQLRRNSTKKNQPHDVQALLSMLPHIVTVLQTSEDKDTLYLAIKCIDMISEAFGKVKPTVVVDAASAIAGRKSLSNEDVHLRALTLHCLATMVVTVRDDLIPLIPETLKVTFAHMQESIAMQEVELHDAAYTFICAVVEYLPFIFSGDYYTRCLKISQQSAVNGPSENRRQFYLLCSKLIDAQEKFNGIGLTWSDAIQLGPKVCFN
jgi:U3 small nucleolar RNA-associated protein 10